MTDQSTNPQTVQSATGKAGILVHVTHGPELPTRASTRVIDDATRIDESTEILRHYQEAALFFRGERVQ